MKRHESLRPLSRDHHHGLVEARALRWALSGRAGTLPEVRTQLLGTWERMLSAHFDDEERWILPLVRDPADATRLRAEHDELRGLIAELERASPGRELLERIAARLYDHIRWEEGHLFPAIEATASDADLASLAGQLAARRSRD